MDEEIFLTKLKVNETLRPNIPQKIKNVICLNYSLGIIKRFEGSIDVRNQASTGGLSSICSPVHIYISYGPSSEIVHQVDDLCRNFGPLSTWRDGRVDGWTDGWTGCENSAV